MQMAVLGGRAAANGAPPCVGERRYLYLPVVRDGILVLLALLSPLGRNPAGSSFAGLENGRLLPVPPPRHPTAVRMARMITGLALLSIQSVSQGRCKNVAGHLTQSLPYRFPVQVLLQLLYHFRRVHYTS